MLIFLSKETDTVPHKKVKNKDKVGHFTLVLYINFIAGFESRFTESKNRYAT